MTGYHWVLPPPSAGGLYYRGRLAARWTWISRTNQPVGACFCSLSGKHLWWHQGRSVSCVGCCDLSVRQEYVGVWSCKGVQMRIWDGGTLARVWHCRGQRLGPLSGSAVGKDSCPVCFNAEKKEGQTGQPFMEEWGKPHLILSFCAIQWSAATAAHPGSANLA